MLYCMHVWGLAFPINTAGKEETSEATSADRRSLLYTKSANPGFASAKSGNASAILKTN